MSFYFVFSDFIVQVGVLSLLNHQPRLSPLSDNKCRLNVQHLLKVFLGNKLFVKKRIRAIGFVLDRLEQDSCDKTKKFRQRKMKLLNEEELFLRAISKRFYQFEQHLELLFKSNKSLIRKLRMDYQIYEIAKEFSENSSVDTEFFQEEGNLKQYGGECGS